MKILGIIGGILLIIGGCYCIATPLITYSTLGPIMGIAMIVEGAISGFTWNTRRMMGIADGWSLAGAVISILLGTVVLGSGVLQIAIDTFLAYLVGFWLIVGGITRIAASFTLRKLGQEGDEAGKNWWILLLIGILVIIVGIMCLCHPVLTMISVGLLMGISVVSSGISLLVASLNM